MKQSLLVLVAQRDRAVLEPLVVVVGVFILAFSMHRHLEHQLRSLLALVVLAQPALVATVQGVGIAG
jgi:hypothetical protein